MSIYIFSDEGNSNVVMIVFSVVGSIIRVILITFLVLFCIKKTLHRTYITANIPGLEENRSSILLRCFKNNRNPIYTGGLLNASEASL